MKKSPERQMTTQIVLGCVSPAERSDLMSVLWKAGQ